MNINFDLTKFNYVIQALGNPTAVEVSKIINGPPEINKCDSIKKSLICVFDLTHEDKDAIPFAIDRLGDKKPTGLLHYMETLVKTTDIKFTIFGADFWQNLSLDA